MGVAARGGLGLRKHMTLFSQPGSSPNRGGILRIGTVAPLDAPEPLTMRDPTSLLLVQLAGEYLAWPDPAFGLAPRLAAGWTTPDGISWTFFLRRGVSFQNGKTLDASDVVASFQRLLDPSYASPALASLGSLLEPEGVVAQDSHTVVFRLNSAFVDFPYLVSAFNANAVILPRDYRVGSFLSRPAGTGPFVLSSYVEGSGASFQANPSYWDSGFPYLDGVQVRFFPTLWQALEALARGEVDLVPHVEATYLGIISSNQDVLVRSWPSTSYVALAMRTDLPPFDDVHLRLAVASCIDREGAVRGILLGHGELANDHVFAPSFPLSRLALQAVPQRNLDLAAASRYLSMAGRPRGFAVELVTENDPRTVAFGELVAANCQKVGIDVRLNVQPRAAYLGNLPTTSSSVVPMWLSVQFGLTPMAAGGTPSQLILPSYLSSSLENASRWQNPEFGSVFGDYVEEVDPSLRAVAARDLASLQNSQVPVVIAFWPDELCAQGMALRGVPSGPAGLLDLRGVWLAA